MAERAGNLLIVMSSTVKRNPIGMVSGVLSLTGLCVGIYALRKKKSTCSATGIVIESKNEELYGGLHFISGQHESLELSDNSEAQDKMAEDHAVPDAANNGLLENGRTGKAIFETAASEAKVPFDDKPAPAVPDLPSTGEAIAELHQEGKSNLAIARALGISLGEVQLTIKLRGFGAAGAVAGGQNRGSR